MDVLDFGDVKSEKATAMQRFNRFRSFAKLFRLVELCLALVFLFWLVNRLPFAVKISGEFLRRLAVVIASPLFVFLLSNAIIATLMIKSGRFGAENIGEDNAGSDLYDEVLKNREVREKPLPEEVEFEDKRMISEVNTNTSTNTDTTAPTSDNNVDDVKADPDPDPDIPRVYTRSKSEKLVIEKQPEVKLRRSETEKLKTVNRRGDTTEEASSEEEMSNEEFQKTIEAFIAKQLQFRRQESLGVVLHTGTSIAVSD